MSAIGLGTNAFGGRADARASAAVMSQAIDLGMTFFDTADVYGGGQSETMIGDALAGRRHEAMLATKAGLIAGPGPMDRGASRHHLTRQLEQSLKRLRTDYIDLYQIHAFDPDTPLEETAMALDAMVRSGKVRYIGASNFHGWELMKALAVSDRLGLSRYVSLQPSYSLGDRVPEEELIPLCLDQGVGLVAYFPLAGGLLTGKYTPGAPPPPGSRAETTPGFAPTLQDEARMALAQGVAAIAREIGCTPAQLSLAWLLTRPSVATAIAGATRAEQVKDNAAAADVEIPADVLARLEELSDPFRKSLFDESRLPAQR